MQGGDLEKILSKPKLFFKLMPGVKNEQETRSNGISQSRWKLGK